MTDALARARRELARGFGPVTITRDDLDELVSLAELAMRGDESDDDRCTCGHPDCGAC